MPLALVSTNRSTGVPSLVLPKDIFSMPARTLPPPFASCPASAGILGAQRTVRPRPTNKIHRRMDELLVTRNRFGWQIVYLHGRLLAIMQRAPIKGKGSPLRSGP